MSDNVIPLRDNVVTFTGETTLPIPAERVLNAALAAKLKDVVIYGTLESGEEYLASSLGGLHDTLWQVKQAERLVLYLGDDE